MALNIAPDPAPDGVHLSQGKGTTHLPTNASSPLSVGGLPPVGVGAAKDTTRGVPDATGATNYGPSVPVMSLADISSLMASASSAASRVDELTLTAEQEHGRIDTWLQQATKTDRERIAFVTAQCEQFMLARRAEDHRSKSFTTPWGSISSREQQPEYVRDDAVLLAWARANGYLREPKPLPGVADWAKIREAIIMVDGTPTVDGEPVPGVTVSERPPSVVVNIDHR